MATERINHTPAIVGRVLADRLWGPRDLFVIDVGASGGIESHWRLFEDRVRAIGFEPLVAEVERLQHAAAGTKVQYEAGFVTCRDGDQPSTFQTGIEAAIRNNAPLRRSSAVRAHQLMRMNYAEQVFNSGAPVDYSDRRVVLDEYIASDEYGSVDFLKVDTDGHDYQVLLGGDELLRRGGALGIAVEVWFDGAGHDDTNTFANIDRFLRARGFSLYELQPYRYSRAALPAPFVYDIPAQTVRGQVVWADAVYFRDLASDYESRWSYQITAERVLKLACLYDVFGLADCAAELLMTRREIVGEATGELLDLLAAAAAGKPASYEQLVGEFEQDPQTLYRSRRVTATTGD